jgi:hypothetical protein
MLEWEYGRKDQPEVAYVAKTSVMLPYTDYAMSTLQLEQAPSEINAAIEQLQKARENVTQSDMGIRRLLLQGDTLYVATLRETPNAKSTVFAPVLNLQQLKESFFAVETGMHPSWLRYTDLDIAKVAPEGSNAYWFSSNVLTVTDNNRNPLFHVVKATFYKAKYNPFADY